MSQDPWTDPQTHLDTDPVNAPHDDPDQVEPGEVDPGEVEPGEVEPGGEGDA